MVDDDPLILRLCSLILKKNKIDHITFQDPERCVELPPDERITHVFLDIRMPSINGVELCHTLKEKYPGYVRFIALTAHVLREERDSILAEGFDEILSKPFHEVEMLAILRNTLRKAKVSQVIPDLSALRQMTLNDESLFQSVLSQFVEETSDDLRSLHHVLASRDAKSVREIVHRLSGRLSQIGVSELGSQFQRVETRLVAGIDIEMLMEELSAMLAKLDELIAQLKLTIIEHSN
jgi:DNA-binding response OmpR family regulator